MDKIYQPMVIEKCDIILESLTEFFEDYEIESLDFAKKYLCDKLTDKFILGELDEEEGDLLFLYNEEEFEVILKELIAGSVLYDLKQKGYVESYEDETTDEMFFLTKKGKKFLKEEKKLN